MPESPLRERLDWQPTPAEYRRIRRLWIRHSIAEDRRSVDGLIATLAPDCVYELIPTGQRWEGHDGARAFYTSFLGAFPDVKFALADIVIGPQGVIEVATMTGTHLGEWAGIAPSGEAVRLTIIIHFPWDRAAQLFAGERVYFDRAELAGALPDAANGSD
jgi:predicted ester cyclase